MTNMLSLEGMMMPGDRGMLPTEAVVVSRFPKL
jgi:hypothetical protein